MDGLFPHNFQAGFACIYRTFVRLSSPEFSFSIEEKYHVRT